MKIKKGMILRKKEYDTSPSYTLLVLERLDACLSCVWGRNLTGKHAWKCMVISNHYSLQPFETGEFCIECGDFEDSL